MRVIKPSRDGYSIVRVENIRGGRVVDDDTIFHLSTELREVLSVSEILQIAQWTNLDVVALVVVAALTEQSVSYDTTSIEHVKHGVGVLSISTAYRASKDHLL